MIDLAEVVSSAVDVYVHAAPDLLARRTDDVGLAQELRRDGIRTAVHRHHFADTTGRARIASDASGFDLRGAIVLNDPVGGLNPHAVDAAIRLGARWVGLPTLDARRYRARLARVPVDVQRVLSVGGGEITVLDDGGALRPAVREILDLVGRAGAVLGLGYLSFAECMAVLRAAADHGIDRVVVTNVRSVMGLERDEIAALAGFPMTFIEQTAWSLYPRMGMPPDLAPAQIAETARWVGADRAVLSSDSGTAGGPSARELLSWACGLLAREGLDERALVALVRDAPARLLGLS